VVNQEKEKGWFGMQEGTAVTSNTALGAVGRDARVQIDLRKRPRVAESVIQGFLFLCGLISILTTIGIVFVLSRESLNFFTRTLWEDTNKRLVVELDTSTDIFKVSTGGMELAVGEVIRISDEQMRITGLDGAVVTVERGVQGSEVAPHDQGANLFVSNKVTLREFFTGTDWNPQIGRFGIWSLVTSTLMTSVTAMLVALPIGLSVAIYLSEYASHRARGILKPIMEVLAGIPTVVYGYFALTFMTPLLRSIFGQNTVEIYNTGSAGIVVGILIVPLVTSMSEDALHAVPDSLRQAAYGLGATKLETAVRVVLPAALSGIAAAFIVAISRAIGETMIVSIAAGAGPAFTFDPFHAAETMTGHIVRISGGDISYDSIDYNSIFAIGLLLFFMTLSLNIISQRVVRRFREVYE
jgi:phosphate transport system permease protein